MAYQEEHWSIEKVLACLKRIVHQDVLPSISQKELNLFEYRTMFDGTEKVFEFLKFVYEKSNYKLEIYGNVDEMMETLRKVDRIPEFIKFSSVPEFKIAYECAMLTTHRGYSETIGSPVYFSRSDIVINVFKVVISTVNGTVQTLNTM